MNPKNVQNPNVDTLVGGLEFGTMEFYDFPFSWEFQKSQLTIRSIIFQRG